MLAAVRDPPLARRRRRPAAPSRGSATPPSASAAASSSGRSPPPSPGSRRPRSRASPASPTATSARSAIEAALLSRLGPRRRCSRSSTTSIGWADVERAKAQGKGIIFLAAHLGNWELAGAFVAAKGYAFDAIARRMANPLFDAYLTRTRLRLGMNIVPDADAVRRVPRTLRAGGSVAFLADQSGLQPRLDVRPLLRPSRQDPARRRRSSRSASTFPSIVGVATHLPSGRFRMAFEAIEIARTGDLERDTDALLSALLPGARAPRARRPRAVLLAAPAVEAASRRARRLELRDPTL